MNKNKPKRNVGKIIRRIMLAIAIIGILYFISSSGNQISIQTLEDYNGCNSFSSCLCRDTCEEFCEHSEWESWLYKKNGECWCVEHNETRRIF